MNDKEYIIYFKEHIKKFYSLPATTKIAIYQNPRKFNTIFIEDINPTHIKIIYGKHWFNKGNCEKIAKIIIPSMIISEIMVMYIFVAQQYLSLFSFGIILGYYTSNLYKLFENVDKLYGFFGNYDKSGKYNYKHIWS